MLNVRPTGIRVVLVDDHPIVLQGLQHLFERQADFAVVACCVDAATALAAVTRHRPDVVVIDLKMPGESGLDLLRALSERHAGCRTVLLTAAITESEVVHASALGANGLVLKESSPDALVECVRRVHAGEQWFDRDTLDRTLRAVVRRSSSAPEAVRGLTARELQIIRMTAEGLRNRAIAERLAISEGTVKVHLHNIYEKLGVDGRMELLLYAQDQGLV